MFLKRSSLAVGIVAALALTACGGSNGEGEGDDVDGAAAAPISTEAPVETPPPTDAPVIEVPAEWPENIPVPELAGMVLTGAVVRGEGVEARYDLRYDGGPLDAQAIYDEYEALVLAAGWTVTDDAVPLSGFYALDGRTMNISADADAEQSQLTVSVVPG